MGQRDVAGGGIAGGKVHEDWPGLDPANLYQGDLRATVDYRSVLVEILVNRCGVHSRRSERAPKMEGHSARGHAALTMASVGARAWLAPAWWEARDESPTDATSARRAGPASQNPPPTKGRWTPRTHDGMFESLIQHGATMLHQRTGRSPLSL